MCANRAGAVLDASPINQAGPAPILHDRPEALVFALVVLDQRAADELVIELAQCEHEALGLVLAYDRVRLLDHRHGLGLEPPRLEGLARHQPPPMTRRGGRRSPRLAR